MRLRNDPLATEKLNQSQLLITKFPFKLEPSMTLEIGMGKGEMLSEMAANDPKNVYIGLEKYLTVAAKAAKKAQALKLNNFLIVCDDAQNLLNIFKGKISTIWLTFSDPWPKKRHAKRRLTHHSFLDLYAQLLTLDGTLKFKTDNDQLFAYSLVSLKANNWKIIDQTNDLHQSELNKNNVMTGYERKWNEEGKNINFLIARFDGNKDKGL